MGRKPGIALILSIIMVSLLMFLGLYFLTNSLTEERIAKSQGSGVSTYYLAESGMNHMFWKIVFDPLHEAQFMNNANWATTTVVNDPFGPGSGSYEVTASNTAPGYSELVATGEIDIGGGKYSQRVIKTALFRPVGTSTTPIGDSAGFAAHYIKLRNAYINFLNGSAHCNRDFQINNNDVRVFTNSDLRAGELYKPHISASTTILGWLYAQNWVDYYPGLGTGTADVIPMPSLDFDSASADSFLNQATSSGQYHTSAQFEDFLWDALINNGGDAVLSNHEIIYVDGSVELKGGVTLRNPNGGILAVNGDFTCGKTDKWKVGATTMTGDNSIIFQHVASRPSGIMASGALSIDQYTDTIDFEGVLYSIDDTDIYNLPAGSYFYLAGAAIGRVLDIDSCNSIWLTIEHDQDIINDTLEYTPFSPTISIQHWEEEY